MYQACIKYSIKQSIKLSNGSFKYCCRAASLRLQFVAADIKWGVNDTINQDIQSCLSIQLIRSLSFEFHVNLIFNRKFQIFQKKMENEKVAIIFKISELKSSNRLKDTCKHLTVWLL